MAISQPHMISKGQKPLAIFQVNSSYILGVYQGTLSKFDLLLKFRQKDLKKKNGWSNIRTPKHIHWAVDVLIKMNLEKGKTQELLSFLIKYWDNDVKPITSKEEHNNLLKSKIINEINTDAKKYSKLSNKGEYSIKFLLLIAKLLMYQEKTNYPQAYMFRKLLVSLENGEDIFKIISVATHSR